MTHRPTAQIDDQSADDRVLGFGHVTLMHPRTACSVVSPRRHGDLFKTLPHV